MHRLEQGPMEQFVGEHILFNFSSESEAQLYCDNTQDISGTSLSKTRYSQAAVLLQPDPSPLFPHSTTISLILPTLGQPP
jgi:hypothetical protein